jgi:hypothetical protein
MRFTSKCIFNLFLTCSLASELDDINEFIDISEIAAKLNAQTDELVENEQQENNDDDSYPLDPDSKLAKDEWRDNWGIKCGLCAEVNLSWIIIF